MAAVPKTLRAVAVLGHATKVVSTALTKPLHEAPQEIPEGAQVVILHSPELGPEALAETQTRLVPVVAVVVGRLRPTLLNPGGFPVAPLPGTVIFTAVAEMAGGLPQQEIVVIPEIPEAVQHLLHIIA